MCGSRGVSGFSSKESSQDAIASEAVLPNQNDAIDGMGISGIEE